MMTGRWVSLLWSVVLLGFVIFMNGMLLYEVMTTTGPSLFERVEISPILMRQISFVLAIDVIFCTAAAVFITMVARGISKDHWDQVERNRRWHNIRHT